MNQSVSILNQTPRTFTPGELSLIKDTVARGATDKELQLFLYRCQNMGLDPLKPGQIYFIKYGNSPGAVVIGIEGFRAKAVRTGKLSGIKRGALRNEKGDCIGAWAEVYRSDWQHPAREEVPLSEYSTGKGNWVDMPETMIKKVAEAAALRMAFPDDLGGVYTSEEMDQAEKSRVAPAQPEEGDGIIAPDNGEFIECGAFAKRRWTEVDMNKLREHIEKVADRIEKAKKEGKPVESKWTLHVQRGTDYIAKFENSPFEEFE